MGITNNLPSSRLAQAGVIPNTAARPASPYEGQMVYQQDTDAVLVWNGTAWYPNWNTGWGTIAFANSTTNYTLTTSSVISTGMTVSFTAVANRRYKVTYNEPQAQLTSVQTGTTSLEIRQTNAAGTVLSTAVIQQATSGVGVYNQTMTTLHVGTFSAGSITIVGCSKCSHTTGSPALIRLSTAPAFILVEDIGPA